MSDRPLAVTPGEPGGVGVDLVLMLWAGKMATIPRFFLIDDPERVRRRAQDLNLSVPVREIAAPAEVAGVFEYSLPVLPHSFPVDPVAGHPDPVNGKATVEAIDRAVALVRSGAAGGLVTNPIQKENLYRSGFDHKGHTEYLGALAGPGTIPVMLLATPGLRVVPVTIHVPLSAVPGLLTTHTIVTTGRITAEGLRRDFGIDAPRLAIAGLNPHAGEQGTIGREDIEVVAPAVEQLQRDGIDAVGPLPADTLFHAEARRRYDVVLGMYHDQVLVALKTLDFWGGVNVTLGLPFVRTSPDHGTALALAGTGRARVDSLRASVVLADEMIGRRMGAGRSGEGR